MVIGLRKDASHGNTRVVAALALCLAVGACGLRAHADNQFGDQHFKTAIALVELYKVRHGAYPQALTDLDFVGDWDKIALQSVEYTRLTDGYELNAVRGWVGRPALEYPAGFWSGLGLKKSNVARP